MCESNGSGRGFQTRMEQRRTCARIIFFGKSTDKFHLLAQFKVGCMCAHVLMTAACVHVTAAYVRLFLVELCKWIQLQSESFLSHRRPDQQQRGGASLARFLSGFSRPSVLSCFHQVEQQTCAREALFLEPL